MSNEATPRLGARVTVIVLLVALFCVGGSVGAAVLIYDQLQGRGEAPPATAPVNVAEQGLLVTAVAPDSPAARAGLRRGDIVLRVGETAVNTPPDLQQIVGAAPAEAVLTLTVQRGDEMMSAPVELAPSSPRLGISVLAPGAAGVAPQAAAGVLVSVVVPDTPAARAGLRAGDRVTAVNEQPVEGEDALRTAVAARQPGDALRLTWRRNGQSFSADVLLAAHPDDRERPYLGIEFAPESTP
jgi:serine protease Do